MLGGLAAAATAAAGAGYAWLTGPLLEGVLRGRPVELRLGALEVAGLGGWTLAALLVCMATLKGVAQLLQGGLLGGLAQRVLADIRRTLYARLLRTPPLELEARHSGELLSRFTADVAALEVAVGAALGSYVRDGLQLLALLGVCALIDWKLFLLTFLVLPGAVLPVARFARSIKKAARKTQEGLGELGSLGGEVLSALPVVQAYRLEPALSARFEAAQAGYLGQMKRSLALRGAVSPTVEVLGVAGAAMLVAWGARQVAAEPALASHLLSFLTASLLLYAPLKSLSATFGQVVTGLAAAERLFELTGTGAEVSERDAGPPLSPLSRALAFEDARARYPDGRLALSGLTLELKAGETLALVGPSGGGKSSILAALLGFLPLEGGRLTWDGRPLEGSDAPRLREQVAWVPQEPVLFTGTIAENLRMADPHADEASLWQALTDAGADDFVRTLPDKLHSQVGERGAMLSGGQRQRLAIARAFLARPSVLLLDEPTSALDAQSEALVQVGLDRLREGCTTLLIAHRLATAERADRVAVIEAGAVVELGTPSSLRALGGRYARLWSASQPSGGNVPPTRSAATG